MITFFLDFFSDDVTMSRTFFSWSVQRNRPITEQVGLFKTVNCFLRNENIQQMNPLTFNEWQTGSQQMELKVLVMDLRWDGNMLHDW